MVIGKESQEEGAVVAEAHAESEAAPAEGSLERLLEHLPAEIREPSAAGARPAPPLAPGLRTARVVAVDGHEILVAFRGREEPVAARLDDGVEHALVQRALSGDDAVLVEVDPEIGPVIVGLVQRRVPAEIEIKAAKVTIDAGQELLLRSGRGAMRIREDGDVELVGSRISTLSRGLYRIVGRILRLN
jgi:hypothetical protein